MSENTVFTQQAVSPIEQPISATPPPLVPQEPPPGSGPPTLGSSFGIVTALKIIGGIIAAIVIVFLIIFFVRGRSSIGSNNNVTLTYWGLWEDDRVMQSVFSDFHTKYPNITVSYVKQDIKQYNDRLLTRIQNGTGPDIFRYHSSWLYFLSSNLLPLSSDVIAKDDFQKTFYPVVSRDLIKNGAIYGIPLEIDTLGLYTNTQILQAAGEKSPTTWDEFRRIAKVLTTKDENNQIKTAGAAMGTFDNITHAPDIVSLLFAQSGVDVNSLTANAQNASVALTFYTDFANSSENVWDSRQDPSLLSFAKGNLGMYFGYSWDYFTIKAMNPDLQFQVTPVPHLPGQNQTIASYWVEGVSAKTKYPKESLMLMHFLSQRETEQKLFSEESKTRLFGEPYARVDLADLLKSNAILYPFVKQAPNATSSFFADNTYGPNDTTFNSRMNTYLGNAVRSIFNNTSADSAITTLIQGVGQVLSNPIQHGQ